MRGPWGGAGGNDGLPISGGGFGGGVKTAEFGVCSAAACVHRGGGLKGHRKL